MTEKDRHRRKFKCRGGGGVQYINILYFSMALFILQQCWSVWHTYTNYTNSSFYFSMFLKHTLHNPSLVGTDPSR